MVLWQQMAKGTEKLSLRLYSPHAECEEMLLLTTQRHSTIHTTVQEILSVHFIHARRDKFILTVARGRCKHLNRVPNIHTDLLTLSVPLIQFCSLPAYDIQERC